MRFLLVTTLVLAACQSASDEAGLSEPDPDDGGSAPETPGGRSVYCESDTDCALASAACCACPSFVVGVNEPATEACGGVMCPTEPSCPNNVRAACDTANRECVLECLEVTCTQSFEGGYGMDPGTGCLACIPAITDTDASLGCDRDSDCVATREDCCGCARGGTETAVLASQAAAFDQALRCDDEPVVCPGVNICDPDDEPRCIQGACVLTTADLPANACGRADLPACPAGQACVLNRAPAATELGVGICATP